MSSAPYTTQVPYKDKITDNETGLVDRSWATFFRNILTALDPLGTERYCAIVNNQTSDANIDGLSFDAEKVSQASVDYLIQRVTTGGGATELIESGTFYAAYKPTSEDWVLSDVPSTAGVTLSITADGQVQYTSSNISGTASISKITFRARSMAAKNSLYSVMGR